VRGKLYAPVFYHRTNSHWYSGRPHRTNSHWYSGKPHRTNGHWYSGRPQWQSRAFTKETNISQRNSIYGGFKFLFVFVVCVQKITFPTSCEKEIKDFYNMMFLYRD
jgi:hypothetical protein